MCPVRLVTYVSGRSLGFFLLIPILGQVATIELAPDHKVISTGPYALVRHPMYAGSFVMLLGSGIALGSWNGVPVIVALTSVRVWRIIDEEKFLARHLPGYVAYQDKVRYRLIPLVW